MNHDIEFVDLGEGLHLELAAPLGILPYPTDIVVDILVVFNEKLVELLVFLDVVDAGGAELRVVVLCATQLVRQRSEQTIAVRVNLLDLKAESEQLLAELLHVNFVL